MKLYIIDEQLQYPSDLQKMQNHQARNWKAMVGPETTFIVWDMEDGFCMLTEDGISPILLDTGVVIMHRPYQELIDAIADIRKNIQNLVAITVSGSPYDGPSSSLNWYYHIRTPVSKEDRGFSERFKLFWDNYSESAGQNANFDLLEPTAVPESILAYTLAVQYGLDISGLPNMVATADSEYEKILPHLRTLLDKNINGLSATNVLPALNDFQGLNMEEQRFQAFCNAIDLLREDL